MSAASDDHLISIAFYSALVACLMLSRHGEDFARNPHRWTMVPKIKQFWEQGHRPEICADALCAEIAVTVPS